jgi:hypothetical protein
MKLLLLLPAFILMSISGYNLSGGYNTPGVETSATITPEMLHMSVILLCVVFISFVVRSMFVVKYTETTVPERAPKFYHRLAQQLNLF